MAVGWGGLFAALGLLIGAGWSTWPRLVLVCVTFAVGGFLAGVRAETIRPLHSALAAAAAYAFHAVYVALSHLIALLGGPEGPRIAPGPNREWGLTALAALVAAMAGGVFAGMWLRPRGSRRGRYPA
jgi:hypothetical protein